MTHTRYHIQPVDGVIRVPGPLRARVTVEAQNATRSAGGRDETHYAPLFHYTLDIPAGEIWQLPVAHAGALTAALGANSGIRVVVDPAPNARELVPPILAAHDLPCDLAVSELDDAACCVPRPCDPIPPGAMVAMPPGMPSLVTAAARGGVVQPRYFDGLFLTRADLETQQRRLRMEQQLQNRAHGAGVVWGLVPSYNGRAITVGLGYGVDCCGNDLLVTMPYEVPVDALLAEAAELVKTTSGGLHLLLEYVESPESPRPVHDECAPGITRSEPSRIRETVRLRLVAPRNFDGRGPIDDLLATGLIDSEQTVHAPDVPFDLWVRMPHVILDFLLGTDERQIVLVGGGSATPVELETRNKPDWLLTAATVRVDDLNDPAPPAQVASLDPATGTVKWTIRGAGIESVMEWQARRAGVRGTYAGTTRFTLFVEIDTQELRLTANATTITFTPDPPGPCAHEPCSAGNAKLFPTEAPWIHGFPDAPDEAAGPRVLDLALSEVGLIDEIDVDVPTQNAIRDLLGAWCESLLWRGTTCRSPLPHGIVIGCVRLSDGRIVDVDAWGGRRWVGRPALLGHVATQLGILPPDMLLSKVATLACCSAKQPVPEPPPPVVIERRVESGPVRDRVDRVLAARTPPLPPLVRPTATRLAIALARVAPLEAIAGIEPPAIERLRAARIASAHDVLTRDPDELVRDVGADHATTAARALAGAEELVDTIGRVTGEQLAATGATSRATVDRVKLAQALARALRRVPASEIEKAVAEALA